MIIEVARLAIKPGEEAAFEAAVERAVPVFRQAKGCIGMSLHRCVEEPTLYDLVVRWETLESHTVDFRGSELFHQWRGLVGPHFAAPPDVRHYSVAMPKVAF